MLGEVRRRAVVLAACPARSPAATAAVRRCAAEAVSGAGRWRTCRRRSSFWSDGDVARRGRRQLGRDVGREEPRGREQHDARRRGAARRRRGARSPARPPARLPEQREHEQRQRGARGVGDRDQRRARATACCSALSAVTAARIGPAHGVHTSDERRRPAPTPDQKPSPPARSRPPARAASGWKSRPSHSPTAGTSSTMPTNASRTIAMLRSRSCGRPSAREHARGGEREDDERDGQPDGDAERAAAAARGRRRDHHRQHRAARTARGTSRARPQPRPRSASDPRLLYTSARRPRFVPHPPVATICNNSRTPNVRGQTPVLRAARARAARTARESVSMS